MTMPSNRSLRGPWRRRLFWAWVAGSAAIALLVGIAGPFADVNDGGRSVVALASPAIMFFMLATGIGWLVMLVTTPPRNREGDQKR